MVRAAISRVFAAAHLLVQIFWFSNVRHSLVCAVARLDHLLEAEQQLADILVCISVNPNQVEHSPPPFMLLLYVVLLRWPHYEA